MKTGQLIRELRSQKGITQEDLAAKTYTNVRTIQRIENGDVDPRAYTLQMIANALEVDFQELINCDKADAEAALSKEENFWLPLLHLSGLFNLLLPPVLIWYLKKDDIKNIREHGIDVINFQLSMLIFIIPCALLAVLIIPILILIFLGIFSMIVVVVNTIKVINNQPYRYPMTIRILKP
jgi:uncharacterized Tic20 family protein